MSLAVEKSYSNNKNSHEIWERFRDQRRRESNRKTYDIKKLWQHSHEIINLAVLGLKNTEIAKVVGVTSVTVNNTVNSTLGKQKLNLLRGARDCESLDLAKKIEALTEKALTLYDEVLSNEREDATLSKQLHVADKVLIELSGIAAPKKFEGRFAHAIFSPEELEEIKRKGREAAREVGLLVSEEESS